MNIHFYGHSAIGIEVDGINILVDPFISGNPKASHIDIQSLKADYILLTHAHYDHVMDVEAIVENTNATLISNHEIIVYYDKKGLKGHEMNAGGSWDFEFGRLKMVNAVHTSTFLDGSNGGNPVGFVLKTKDKTIYISGDTALTMDMKLIPLFHKVDLAIFPVGGNFTMDIDEAIIASDFVECNKVLGVHYDTSELITIDHQEAINKFKDKGKELILMDIGEKIKL